MKAKINDKTGKVEWIGHGSGESWVRLPDDLPDQTDANSTLHYDSDTDTWEYK